LIGVSSKLLDIALRMAEQENTHSGVQ